MSNEKGVTLVEALITLAIAVVVGAMLLIIMVNSAGLFYQQEGKVEQGLSVNDALLNVKETVRGASNVVATYPEAGSPTYTSGNNQLVLKVAAEDLSGNQILGVSDYFVFFKDAGKLRFKTFPDTQSSRKAQDQIFTTKLDSLIFEYFDGQIPPQSVQPNLAVKIKITMVLKQKAGRGFETNVATAEANLRND